MRCYHASTCPLYSASSVMCSGRNDVCIKVYKKFFEKENIAMKTENKIQKHADICHELNKLYERKNHDYGDSFHQTFLEEGMAMARIRLGDKFSRFKTLSKGAKQEVSDESIRDTLIDLANYAIMTVMEMDLQKESDGGAIEDEKI